MELTPEQQLMFYMINNKLDKILKICQSITGENFEKEFEVNSYEDSLKTILKVNFFAHFKTPLERTSYRIV